MTGRNWRPRSIFAAGADLGFVGFEVSGIDDSAFYDEVRPGDFDIVSLHDPAPPVRGQTRVGSTKLRAAGIVYTSLDEERRRQAVAITRRSIQVAAEFGARIVVLHLGQTSADPRQVQELEGLFLAGNITSPEAALVRARLATARTFEHAEHMAALRRSLDELIPLASARGIRLGLENRPGHEIPDCAEVGEILSWYPDDAVGYWHDTGHAERQQALGISLHADHLKNYARHLIGLHLHDLVGLELHKVPGTGRVDWTGLALLVPDNSLRVIEVDRTVTADALGKSVGHLRSTGWLPEQQE